MCIWSIGKHNDFHQNNTKKILENADQEPCISETTLKKGKKAKNKAKTHRNITKMNNF